MHMLMFTGRCSPLTYVWIQRNPPRSGAFEWVVAEDGKETTIFSKLDVGIFPKDDQLVQALTQVFIIVLLECALPNTLFQYRKDGTVPNFEWS